MSDIVYINGDLKPLNEAWISVTDYGFLFGYGLFETIRAYDGKVFSLDAHVDRLVAFASRIGIPVARRLIIDAVHATMLANRLQDARVRIMVTIGEGPLTPAPQSCRSSSVIVIAVPYHPYPPSVYERGWRVMISTTRRNTHSLLPDIKSFNFLENLLIKQEARDKGVDDALVLNESGFLAEASSSNVFIITDGMLKTPRIGSGLLPGITRSLVLGLGKKLGIRILETDIGLDEVMNASEIFLTNSMMEIMPVVEVESRKIGSGTPGSLTRKLAKAYSETVKSG
jgi:branched-chain amino acid aminotransferase